jgi:transposase InsO family protein
MLDLHITQPVCLEARVGDEAWSWHACYGHVNFTALRKMATTVLARGLQGIEQVDQLSEACLAGKQKHAPFPHQAMWRVTRSLELHHGDLCGPITPTTPSGKKYFFLLVDDFSRYMLLSLLPSKDSAATDIKKIQVAAERKSENLLGTLRIDRGDEFSSGQFKKYCQELGIRRELITPYTS